MLGIMRSELSVFYSAFTNSCINVTLFKLF